ncbi:unnamed protein product, partial [marine sediment metagenome]
FIPFYCCIEKRGSQKPVTIVRILGIKVPIERERAKKKKKEKIKKEKKFDFRALLNKPFLTKVFQFIKK